MDVKDLIKADSETFWAYMLKTSPKNTTIIYITPDKAKGKAGKGKSRKEK